VKAVDELRKLRNADEATLEAYFAQLSATELRELDQILSTGSVFAHRYYSDPEAFCHDCITWIDDERIRSYQTEMLMAVHERKRVALRGTRGLGKSTALALLILHFVLTRADEDWLIPTTASNWQQLRHYLWPEIHKWSARVKWDKVGRDPFLPNRELQSLAIKYGGGEAFAISAYNAERSEGAHAKKMLYVFDEAKLVAESMFISAEGAFSNAGINGFEAFEVACSTPGAPLGYFYDICRQKPGLEAWYPMHITIDRVVAEGAVRPDWPAEMARLFGGEETASFRNQVLGEFAESSSNAVFPQSWLEQAMRLHNAVNPMREWADLLAIGLDVADGGADETMVAYRTRAGGYTGISEVEALRERPNEMVSVSHLARELAVSGKHIPIVVDGNGVGANVIKRLRELGFTVVRFIGQERAEQPKSLKATQPTIRALNTRVMAFWSLRDLLDPTIGGGQFYLPPSTELLGELAALKYDEDPSGRIVMTAKNELRKTLGRSTDRADAVAMAAYESPLSTGRAMSANGAPVHTVRPPLVVKR
jgi:sorbitol-specific phosphotransferase system component IIA